jgi:receptor protein-tyrosine kinase
MAPMWREQYRRLAAMLHDAQGNSGLRVVMVGSAAPAEGKTLTAANLALTLGDSYLRRVLLIDADLRKPALHHLFRVNTTSGLIDGLEAPADVRVVLRQVSSHLWVLPAGRPTSDPMAGLTSERMRRLVQEARASFDWVIIDTPPLLLLPDAHLLSSFVDSAVLVIRAKSTPHDLVKRAVDIIGRNRITGVVLNRADAPDQPAYANSDSYEQYEQPLPGNLVR